MYSFFYLEPVCCSMSSSNCCFLTCIQSSQEAGQVFWYSHLFQNFPQFVVIHTVKGFGIVKKAELDVFLELTCFFNDPADVGNLISGSSDFSKTSLNIWKFMVHVLLKQQVENLHPHKNLYKDIWDSLCEYLGSVACSPVWGQLHGYVAGVMLNKDPIIVSWGFSVLNLFCFLRNKFFQGQFIVWTDLIVHGWNWFWVF